MSRTLAIDGCHELCLLHLSDLSSIRHALVELTAGQQILVSSDLPWPHHLSQATSSSHRSLR